MEILIVLGIGVIIVAVWGYSRWLKWGMAPRAFKTNLSRSRLTSLFSDKVARAGWKIVNDEDELVVAQANAILGGGQQIALQIGEDDDGKTLVAVGVHRWLQGRLMPAQAHTVRIRINSFVRAVQAEDPGVVVVRDMDAFRR